MPNQSARVIERQAEASLHRYTPAIRGICVVVFCLTLALTLGQGLVRYRHDLGKTGPEFVELNQYDALVHVTLAQRIMAGLGDTLPTTSADGPIGSSQPAFEKAPGYPFLLAVLFRITGVGSHTFEHFRLWHGLDARQRRPLALSKSLSFCRRKSADRTTRPSGKRISYGFPETDDAEPQ